jgi:DNA-binding MarR family transcriptional regulator
MQDQVHSSISYLFAQIGRAHRSCAEESLNEVGLHVGQEICLMYLFEENALTQSQLAEKMGVQPPTVHKMLSRMESSGLVDRQTDAHDSRVSRIHLTDKGRTLQTDIARTWVDLEARTVAHLTLEERLILRRLLLQVLDNLTDTP